MKRKMIIRTTLVLLLCCLAFGGYYGYRVFECRQVIAQETVGLMSGERWLSCYWRVGNAENVAEIPSWWRIIVGARPMMIHYEPPTKGQHHIDDVKKVADVFRFFRSLEAVNVLNGREEVMVLMRGLGKQPHLKNLSCFRALVPDTVSDILPRFPQLRGLTIESQWFTARGFPKMSELEGLDFSGSPISVEGLQAVAECPKLRMIKIADHPAPTRDHRNLIEALKRNRPSP